MLAVVEAYEAGATSRKLAEQFDLARSTAVSLLRKHGVGIRYPRLTPEQRARIIELYLSGVSQKEIARRFERDPGNIWHVLERAGLKLESLGGVLGEDFFGFADGVVNDDQPSERVGPPPADGGV